jgi:hypothetical protein
MILLHLNEAFETRITELSAVGESEAMFAYVRNVVTANWPLPTRESWKKQHKK